MRKCHLKLFNLFNIAVVIQFYPWFKFYFPLFQTHYHNYNTQKQEKIKSVPRMKLNNNMANNKINSTFKLKRKLD